MKNIIILTSSEERHSFLKKIVSNNSNINTLRTYCEKNDDTTLSSIVKNENKPKSFKSLHLCHREQTEIDFFQPFNDQIEDNSNSVYIARKQINLKNHITEIINLNPDLIISFGCSIIKGKLLDVFKGRFINVHLGLSPYYRGSGTNYWPMVYGKFEYLGATFMHIDAGIDTGKIIHQIRPKIFWGDSPSQIGNRLITDVAYTFIKLISNFESLLELEQLSDSADYNYYRQKDYTNSSVNKLYQKFNQNLELYLQNKKERLAKVPILENLGL